MQTFHSVGLIVVLSTLLVANNPPPQAPENQQKSRTDSAETADLCAMENEVFAPGEEITYAMYYNWKFVWMSAGEVTFRVEDAGDQYHLQAHGSTYKSYDVFFKVRDYYDTYVDKETLLPTVSIRDIEEGPYTLYDKTTFDRNKQIVKSLRGHSREKAEVRKFSVDRCMHDILSIIYFSRNLDFSKMDEGEAFPIEIFMDEKTWPLQVTYKGTDEKKRVRGAGKFNTILFSPEVIAGDIFEEGTEMNVWVTNDRNRIPVLIESPLSVGSVKAVIKDYNGLKYKMTAKR